MVTLMDWSQCSRSSMTQLVMLIRVVEKDVVLLQYTLSRGMLTFMTTSNSVRIMVRKSTVHEISFMLYGFLTFLWGELRRMRNGLWCALTNAQDSLSAGVRSLMSSTNLTRRRAEEEKLSRLNGSGLKSLSPRLRLEHPTCSTKIHATVSQTNKI